MEMMSHDKFTSVVVTLWAIWSARRKLIHEGINQSPLSTNLFITHFISEPGEASITVKTHAVQSVQPRQAGRWIPPLVTEEKMNVDVVISHGTSPVAVVCRDHLGTYMGSSVFVIRGLTNPQSLEAIA